MHMPGEYDMQSSRVINLGLIMFLSLSLIGCASMAITGSADVDKSVFGPSKRFAVVSIAAIKTFQGEKGLFQMFKDDKDIPGANTQPMIDRLAPRIVKSLNSSRYISLLPERKVLNSRAYRRVQEDERVATALFFKHDMNVAHHYKYITDPKKLAQLAKQLGVDGVITVNMTFALTASKGSVSVAGLTLGKKSYSAMASVSAMAYDETGKVIWKDSTIKEAEPGDSKAIILIDTTDMTGTNFKKLQPSAIEMGGKAVDVLVGRFNDTMEGKQASFMQSMK